MDGVRESTTSGDGLIACIWKAVMFFWCLIIWPLARVAGVLMSALGFRGKYFIHDCRKDTAPLSNSPLSNPPNPMEFEPWKQEIRRLTSNMTLVGWYSYKAPLEFIQPIGLLFVKYPSLAHFIFFLIPLTPITVWFSFSSFCAFILFLFALSFALTLTLDYTYHIEHRFIVFELANKDRVEFISFDKDRNGIIFQIASSIKEVTEWEQGISRGLVEKVDSSSRLGLEGMLTNIVSMELILESQRLFNPIYFVIGYNCQDTVSDLLKCLAEKSMKLKFAIPGSNEKVEINDDQAVTFVKRLYPNWALCKVQQFPEIPDPFVFEVKGLSDFVSEKHPLLIIKQKVVDALHILLKEGNQFYRRKAIFSKLNKNSLTESLRKADFKGRVDDIVDHISSMWNSILDIVAVVEGVGVVIFYFVDESTTNNRFDEQKLYIASLIGSADPIHIIAIKLGEDLKALFAPMEANKFLLLHVFFQNGFSYVFRL